MLDYDESLLTSPDTVSTARADNYHRVVAPPSSKQLARERLRRSFEETEAVNRVDSVMATRSRFQARTGGSESVIACLFICLCLFLVCFRLFSFVFCFCLFVFVCLFLLGFVYLFVCFTLFL